MKYLFQSIRFRLTAYFLLIFLSLIALISFVLLYNFKNYSLNKGKNSLRDKSFIIGAWIDFSNPDIQGQIDDYISSQDAAIMIQLYDKNANLIGKSGNFKNPQSLPEEARKSVENKDKPFLYESENGQFLIAVNNLYDHDQIKGFVQVLQNRESILANYHYLYKIIISTVVISILLAFAGGLFLVDQILRPINNIMDTVRKIQAEKLDADRLKIFNPHDEIGRLSITINDLLERIQTSIDQQKQFLSDAAHELRTPLTILKGNTEVALLKKSSESPILRKNLHEIDHLISLANDLLMIARFDNRTQLTIKENFNLSALVNSTIDSFHWEAQDRHIQINTHIEKNVQIHGDKTLIKKVLYNILQNALKYSPEKSCILLSLIKHTPDSFELRCIDEGMGIESSKLPYIFQRFYRATEDRNKTIEGTGLGLSIVKSILDVHHYTIKVESEVNKGSTFIIYGKTSM